MQFLFQATTVQRFDVLQGVLEIVGPAIHESFGQAIEHEGIIGIGAVGEQDFHLFHLSSGGV